MAAAVIGIAWRSTRRSSGRRSWTRTAEAGCRNVARMRTTKDTAATSHRPFATASRLGWARSSTTAETATPTWPTPARRLRSSRPENRGTKWCAIPMIMRPMNPRAGSSMVHAVRENAARAGAPAASVSQARTREEASHTTRNVRLDATAIRVDRYRMVRLLSHLPGRTPKQDDLRPHRRPGGRVPGTGREARGGGRTSPRRPAIDEAMGTVGRRRVQPAFHPLGSHRNPSPLHGRRTASRWDSLSPERVRRLADGSWPGVPRRPCTGRTRRARGAGRPGGARRVSSPRTSRGGPG